MERKRKIKKGRYMIAEIGSIAFIKRVGAEVLVVVAAAADETWRQSTTCSWRWRARGRTARSKRRRGEGEQMKAAWGARAALVGAVEGGVGKGERALGERVAR